MKKSPKLVLRVYSVKSGPAAGTNCGLCANALPQGPNLQRINEYIKYYCSPGRLIMISEFAVSLNHSSCIRTHSLTTRVASWSFNTTGLLPFYVTQIQHVIITSNNRIWLVRPHKSRPTVLLHCLCSLDRTTGPVPERLRLGKRCPREPLVSGSGFGVVGVVVGVHGRCRGRRLWSASWSASVVGVVAGVVAGVRGQRRRGRRLWWRPAVACGRRSCDASAAGSVITT